LRNCSGDASARSGSQGASDIQRLVRLGESSQSNKATLLHICEEHLKFTGAEVIVDMCLLRVGNKIGNMDDNALGSAGNDGGIVGIFISQPRRAVVDRELESSDGSMHTPSFAGLGSGDPGGR
jgi:hypothetical protein